MNYKLAVIPGDGTGPEVTREAVRVLMRVAELHQLSIQTTAHDFGAERYFKTGELLSDASVDALRSYDAILLGAIGHPDAPPGLLERDILLKLRFSLDQYINLRPVKLYPGVQSPLRDCAAMDYVVVRENTGGLYTGVGRQLQAGTPDEVAEQTMVYTYAQVERCLRYAFEYALRRHADTPWTGLTDAQRAAGYRAKLTLCGKSNVLTYVFDLWNRVLAALKPQYPTVYVDYVHVDAVCIYMIEDPARFDVIVTTNMFGDIITDLAATTQGGMGIAPGGNLNPEGVSMFEPIGGTAPLFTGKNEINPLAAIGSVGLMLDHLGHPDAAAMVDRAIAKTTPTMASMQAGKMGMSTTAVGNAVLANLS